MKALHRYLALVAVLFVGLFALAAITSPAIALGTWLVANAVIYGASLTHALGTATLTSPQVLLDVLASFRKQFPALPYMGTDFRATPLKLNQQYIAHIPGLPTPSTYDPTTGYANGANSARGLLVDVPVTVSNHPTCPLKWLHLDEIKDVKNRYDEVIGNAGYAIAKGMIDSILAEVNTRNFTHERTIAVADFDYDGLTLITGDLNGQSAANKGRVLLVNTAVANVLAADPRMISKDFAGQLVNGDGYRQWINVAGFALIQEYPDLPSNNGTALTGVTGANSGDIMTKTAHGLQTGDPVTFVSGTTFTGLTAGTRYFAIRATADTFQVATTLANAIAGTEVTLSADGTDGVFQLQENLVGFAFDRRAFAILAGIPEGMPSDLAAQLGIPQTMTFDQITDPDSGISMAAAKWQAGGTGDFFWCPTFVWGAGLGRQGVANAVDALTDKAGLRITSGASA